MMNTKILSSSAAVCLVFLALPAVRTFGGEPSTPAVAPARGKEVLVIKDSKDAQNFNAEDQDVTVNGSENKVTIKGTCHALTVSGDKNQIKLESVATITASGNENEILYAKTVEGNSPQITDTGKDNTVMRLDKTE